MPPLAPVQLGGQVRCGCDAQDPGGVPAGAADPSRRERLRCSGDSHSAPGTLPGAQGISALNKGTRRAPGPVVLPDARRWWPRGTRPRRRWERIPGAARGADRQPPPRRGWAAQRGRRRRRARHPRDAEPIRAPSWRCRPGPAPPAPLGHESCARGSAAAGARGRLAALHGDRGLLQRGRFRALLGERRDGAMAARRRLPVSARRDGGEPGGAGVVTDPEGAGPAAGEREPAVQALPRAQRGLRCAPAVRDVSTGAERPQAGGGAGPCRRLVVSSCPRCPHGRVAERAPARPVCGASGREMLGGGNWRGDACPRDWQRAPQRPEQVPAHAFGRSAALLGAVRVTTITVSGSCRHTRAVPAPKEATDALSAALSPVCTGVFSLFLNEEW